MDILFKLGKFVFFFRMVICIFFLIVEIEGVRVFGSFGFCYGKEIGLYKKEERFKNDRGE